MTKERRIAFHAASLLATALLTTIASGQNVGIGTTTPKSKLSVNGSTASGGLAVGDASYTSTTGTVAPLNGAIIQGKTGIGTPTPLGNLHVVGDFNTIVASGNNPRLNLVDTTLGTADTAPAWLIDNLSDTFRISRQSNIFTPGFSHFRINNDGTVGIGLPGLENPATSIQATLHVGGPRTTMLASGARSYFYGGSNLASDTITNANQSSSILAESNILTKSFLIALNGTVTTSDSRFKNIIGISDRAKDLELLNHIEVTDYTYIDKQASGGQVHKKVIAQQVEQVLPAAINKRIDFVPDIFAKAAKVELKEGGRVLITMEKAHPLKAGDKVRLFDTENRPLDTKVTEADSLSFSIATTADLSKGAFVYGTEQSDVRAVDYEAIAMLNVSATQELSRRMNAKDAEITALKAEVAGLKAANAKLGSLSSEMHELKQAVAAMRSKGESPVRTVSLTE